MEQTVTTCQKEEQRGVCKWFMWLLMVNFISLSLGVLTKAMNIGFMNSRLQIACSIGILICLLRLHREHKLYILAIAFCCVDLVFTILQTFLLGEVGFRLLRELYHEDVNMVIVELSHLFSPILLTSGLCASVFEYLAHSRLVKSTDQRLRKCWVWLTVGTLILFAAMRVVTPIVTAMARKGTLDLEQCQRLNPFMNLPAMLLRIGYVVCLFLTWRGKAGEEGARLCEDAEPCTEEERESQKKRLCIALCLGAIGIALICAAVALAIASINKMSIIGGADWFSFRFMLSYGENGLYFVMMTLGFAAILASILIGSRNKRLQKAAILVSPFLLFQILRVPYAWLHENCFVKWLGSPYFLTDAFDNFFTSAFNAVHLAALFWLFVAVCTTVISVVLSGKVLKDKKWLRVLYIVGVLLISLLVACRYFYITL